MADNVTYQISKSTISEQKMQLTVIHRRPKLSSKEKETAKAEMQKQLFAVFQKYCIS